MLWQGYKTIVIKIHNTGGSRNPKSGCWDWPVHIVIQRNDEPPEDGYDTSILDPFDSSDYPSVSQYLDRAMDKKFDPNFAQETSDKIDQYRQALFDSLQFSQQRLRTFVGCKIEIHIRQRTYPDESHPFHTVHWEQLEDISLWSIASWKGKTGPASVTVRRLVGDQSSATVRPQNASPVLKIFNVLLVVARRYLNDKDEHDWFNPMAVQFALLESEQELKSRGCYQRIHLEVVRPGTLNELESHLERSTRTFQIVHFDMHGIVQNNEAYLEFNQDDDSGHALRNVKVPAGTIAKLVSDHGIDCAVLTACKSAKADSSTRANLSLSFLGHNISRVLAMSYNMPDSMSDIFCTRFYNEMFISREQFASAAAKGRQSLRENPLRWSYHDDDYIELQDWFVPVVYSNEQPDTKSPESFAFGTQLMVILLPWLLWIVVHSMSTFGYISLPRPRVHSFIQPAISILIIEEITDFYSTTVIYIMFCALIMLIWSCFLKWVRLRRKLHFRTRLQTMNQDRKNILRIEGDLRRSRKIFLNNPNDINNTTHQFLEVLTDVWCRTHLVEHRVHVEAEWFIRRFEFRDWRASMRSLFHRYKLLKVSYCQGIRGLSHLPAGAEAKTVVVINNVNSLYPEEKFLENYHLPARKLFDDWLQKNLKTNGEGTENTTSGWYLVLVGKGLQLWFDETLGGSAPLARTVITTYIDPLSFSHAPEKPSRPPSRLEAMLLGGRA